MLKRFIHRFFIVKLVPILSRHPYAVIVFGLLYLILPVDLVPEALTGFLGYIDDLLALFLSIFLFQQLKQKKRTTPFEEKKASNNKSAYDILGIERSASQEKIKKAYRQKMSLYHPDKVAHLGEELQQKAKEQTQEIQRAYEDLTQ